MKLNCGPTPKEVKRAAIDYWCDWQTWFAWYPVRVGSCDCRWLEKVERKAEFVYRGMFFHWVPASFVYRAIASN